MLTGFVCFILGALTGIACLLLWAIFAANADYEAHANGEDLL